MPRPSDEQKKTVERVMHEFKQGELEQPGGRKVKNPKQAIAIALHEAGESNRESPARNRAALRRTKAKEKRGETALAGKEGKAAQDRTMAKATGASPRGRASTAKSANTSAAKTAPADGGQTKADLYAEARKRDVPGRSRMSKRQLERALKA
ncbi:DUF6496 domain-containing protein [Alsobacter sp. KACC 23698]|uniref:DUF6496 domain-containing protein n=1 Tax=Alsobacter sp. KACC 23698 TaxID=3149229 RepID=A0AAU7JLQ9_9HYPH